MKLSTDSQRKIHCHAKAITKASVTQIAMRLKIVEIRVAIFRILLY